MTLYTLPMGCTSSGRSATLIGFSAAPPIALSSSPDMMLITERKPSRRWNMVSGGPQSIEEISGLRNQPMTGRSLSFRCSGSMERCSACMS